MATKGNKILNEGIPTLQDAFVVVVVTEWNEHIVKKLLRGAKSVLQQHGIKVQTIKVPGAVEIPFTIKTHYAYCNKLPDAYIALGTVIQGDTPHFDYVCKFITEGLLQLNLSLDVPVIFGVLTVLDEQQAMDRIGGKHGHKGKEAAITAIKMIALNRKLH